MQRVVALLEISNGCCRCTGASRDYFNLIHDSSTRARHRRYHRRRRHRRGRRYRRQRGFFPRWGRSWMKSFAIKRGILCPREISRQTLDAVIIGDAVVKDIGL